VAIRRHLPRTLSRIPSPRSVAILARNLERQPDGVVRYKILLGLARLVADNPALPLPRAPIVAFTVRTATRLHAYYVWRALIAEAQASEPRLATDTGRLLVAILGDKLELGTQRLFRLLALLYPHDKLHDIQGAIEKGEPRARAAALEILENLLQVELREWVLPLYDDVSDAQRLARISRRLPALPARYPELLAAVAAADETLGKLTAYHSAELADVWAA
jgi:hypothetical protein